MKKGYIFLINMVLGFLVCWFTSYKFNIPFKYNHNNVNDTIYVRDTVCVRDTLLNSVNDTVTYMPKSFIVNVNDVKIDTINTLVNGSLLKSDIKVTFLNMSNINFN